MAQRKQPLRILRVALQSPDPDAGCQGPHIKASSWSFIPVFTEPLFMGMFRQIQISEFEEILA